jgi:hypothetical protein
MKKMVAIILALMMAAAAAGCGASAPTSSRSQKSVETLSGEESTNGESPDNDLTSSAVERLPDGDYKDIGKGTLIIATEGGTSENGNLPVIFVDKSTVMDGLGIHTSEFDGSKLSYVYVDGVLNSKDQYGHTDTSINLKRQNLTVGTHKVEVVQYDTDKLGGKVVTYKMASYEVKAE